MNPTHNNLSVWNALQYAFKTYANHFILLLSATLLVEVSGSIFSHIQSLVATYGLPVVLGVGSLITLLYLFLFLGLRQITLDLYYRRKSTLSRLFSGLNKLPQFIGASVLFLAFLSLALIVILVILIGTARSFNLFQALSSITPGQSIWNVLPMWYLLLALILMIPIIALMSCFVFYPYFILNSHAGAFESLRLSYRSARPHLFTIILLIVLFSIGNFLVVNPLMLIIKTSSNVLRSVVSLVTSSLIKPIELLSFVYLYGHMKKSSYDI